MSTNADFYATYGRFKDYATPRLTAKDVRRFDSAFWQPAACRPDMAVLEVGSGTGLFLAYLAEKGVADFLGIDLDPALAPHVPPAVAAHFLSADVRQFLEDGAQGRTFDRVALFDVLEHFAPAEGVRLLQGLAAVLRPGGRIVVKVPNMGSPWGLGYQYGDLTHAAAYNPNSMRQLALAAGFVCTACYPHCQGSPSRRLRDSLVHGLLSRLLATPPEIWSANFFAVLERPEA